MIARVRTALTGLAALAALVAVVVALPVVLYRFGGSPLPVHLAGWQRFETGLSSRDDGTLLLASIRVCSWLAWVLFTGCVLAETQAAIRGRRSPRLRLGSLQGAAAYLVALAALAFATPSAMTLSASVTAASHVGAHGAGDQPGAPSQSRQIATVATSQQADAPPTDGHLGAPEAPPTSLAAHATRASGLVTVRAGECLWSLARRYLGDGDRYPEIVSLNRGREMGNGQVFTNPSLIEPGWQLLLPASSSLAPAQQDTASHHLGHATADPHYRRRHPAAGNHPAHLEAVHHRKGNGAALRRPTTPRRVTAIGGTVTGGTVIGGTVIGGTVTGNTAARTGVDSQADYRISESANPAGSHMPDAVVFVTGALAGAVLTSLGRLRHRQHQERRRGRRIALPADPAVLATEQRLHAAAPAEPLETLRDALACLEAGILGAGQVLPDVVGLHVTPDLLEVLLAAPAADAPPAPYMITPGRQGMCWQLDLPAIVTVPDGRGAADGGGLAGLACHLLPGLITAGATSAGYLLLDLESLQVTGCDGPPDLVDHVVATVATELATGQWSGWYDLILVGCDELVELGRAQHCTTLDDALDLLEARRAAVAHRVAQRAPADVRELRLTEPDNEDWGLTILISRAEPSAGQMTRLLQLVEDGPGGLGALVAGDPESADGRMAPTVLQLAPDPELADGIVANVVPLQTTVRPRVLSAAEYDAIGSLLASAADLDDVGQDQEPYRAYGGPPWIPQAADMRPPPGDESGQWADQHETGDPTAGNGSAPSHSWAPEHSWATDSSSAPEHSWAPEDDWAAQHSPAARTWLPEHVAPLGSATPTRLDVKILGPFTITGGAEQLQPKQAELVLALALAAPAGLSNSALCSMLGADPDHPKPADAVRQIITRTRRRLGLASDGQEYIVHAGNGQYVLHPDASLDWSRFREFVALGRADDLRAAISLINGQPFTGSYFWWIDIPLAETVRAEIVDTAETLAEFELATGSPRAAAKAARAGLMAETSAEQLWRAVMRAEHAAGNLAGVAEAWRRCLDAIEDIAPGGEPHPDTATLYRQLTMSAREQVQVR
jgi:DNA-binding SARP family transcriptional activator